jgi:NitT/TauT family transport system substrate-binding protein
MLRGKLFPEKARSQDTITKEDLGETVVEAVDTAGITTVDEYKYVPEQKLPAVKGASGYKWDTQQKIVRFPINVWIGWLPIVAANHGFKPNEESLFYKKFGFKVKLDLIDDPVEARNTYASGESHILWGTLDMMVLFAEELMKDSRLAPRICQQIDWSNGGDGIVVRESIQSVKDLKGKTLAFAQHSPSEYYLYRLLIDGGLQPRDITPKYTDTAFGAARAFVSDPQIDGCVSWAPDIYTIPDKVKGTAILSTTADANKLIADVWAVRADFAKDHPAIVKGLVEGIFLGMEQLKKDPEPAFKWMAEGYGFDVAEVRNMKNDAHATNFAENKQFFLNQNNPTNFERTWKTISIVYKKLGRIDRAIPFDQVMDFRFLKQLEQAGTFKGQTDEYKSTFVPQDFDKVVAERPEILTHTIRIHFYPNAADIWHQVGGKLYDPTVNDTLETAGRLAGQFDAATIAITGHCDSSMRGQVSDAAVKELSARRAKAVKEALVRKFNFPAAKFVSKGLGWDEPADPNEPENQAKNRRVEVSIYPPESQ